MRVHTFALAVRSGRTESPSVVVPANVKRVQITLSDLDLAVLQDPATHFVLGIDYLAPDGTWRSGTCIVDGSPTFTAASQFYVGVSPFQPGDTVRAWIDTARPLSFSATVDVT